MSWIMCGFVLHASDETECACMDTFHNTTLEFNSKNCFPHNFRSNTVMESSYGIKCNSY